MGTEQQASDSLAILLQEFQEEMKEVRKENASLLKQNEELMVKISGVQSQMASPQSTQHQLPKPPSITTKNTVRTVYKHLSASQDGFTGWVFSESMHSDSNTEVTRRIVAEVSPLLLDVGKEEIARACKIYFRNLKADDTRRTSGQVEAHRRSIRRKKRLRDKLSRRKIHLQESTEINDWSASFKNKLTSLMAIEYMSSEESDDSDNMLVHPLPWLKKKYRKAFKRIDEVPSMKASCRSRNAYETWTFM